MELSLIRSCDALSIAGGIRCKETIFLALDQKKILFHDHYFTSQFYWRIDMRNSFCIAILAFLTLFTLVHGQTNEIAFIETEESLIDRDEAIIKHFLYFIAMQSNRSPNCPFYCDDEGKIFVEGSDEALALFIDKVNQSIQNLCLASLKKSSFETYKKEFIHFLEKAPNLQVLAQEINSEVLEDFEEIILPLSKTRATMSLMNGCSFETHESSLTTPYYRLRLTPEDQGNISKMMKNMGELGWLGLLKKKKMMEKLGDKILPVHPLRFLGYIASSPSLKKQLPKIMKDLVKKKSFIRGFGKRAGFGKKMTEEINRGNMMRYVPGFSQHIDIDEHILKVYFETRDWEGLIREVMR